ncbi:MAG TPA: hypothetical protein VIJ35_19715, partial [Bradyrhizobium sp.]
MPHPLATGMVKPACAERNGMACAAPTPMPKLNKVKIATRNIFTGMTVHAATVNSRRNFIWAIFGRPAALVYLFNSSDDCPYAALIYVNAVALESVPGQTLAVYSAPASKNGRYASDS